MRHLAPILAALALSACGALPTPPTAPPVAVSADIQFRISQSLAAVKVAHTAILHQRDAADRAGLLTGELRAKVFAITGRRGPINQAIVLAERAANVATATTFDTQIAAAYVAIAEATKLLPGAPK